MRSEFGTTNIYQLCDLKTYHKAVFEIKALSTISVSVFDWK